MEAKGDTAGAQAAFRTAKANGRAASKEAAGSATAGPSSGWTMPSLGMGSSSLANLIRKLRDAIALDPLDFDAHFSLGRALIKSGDKAGAKAALQEAVKINPSHAEARCALGAAIFRW